MWLSTIFNKPPSFIFVVKFSAFSSEDEVGRSRLQSGIFIKGPTENIYFFRCNLKAETHFSKRRVISNLKSWTLPNMSLRKRNLS